MLTIIGLKCYIISMQTNIKKAAELLTDGKLVAFPTETVYGLGADAAQPDAVRRVFKAKQRPYDHPLIVHLHDVKQLAEWAREIPEAALQLAKAFWPGPLTLILKKQPHVLDLVTGHQDTVGLRIPAHPVAQALLQAFGKGVVAPSANKFTHISPTSAAAVQIELGVEVDMILEGGDCEVGVESTIIDLSGKVPMILRPGMITAAQLETILGHTVTTRQNDSLIRVPGMHHLHYAPVTKTHLVLTQDILSILAASHLEELPIALVMHSWLELPERVGVHRVQMAAEAAQYAHDLYRVLRSLDSMHFKQILIEAVPEKLEWLAIQDRIMKASGNGTR